MPKIVSDQHITGEKGVANFQLYCINHSPTLLFREEQKYDYGIDGEIELTKITNDGKKEATGEIIKVQLKSTKEKSYICNETVDSFDFIAKTNDIKYWNDHKLPVVVVMYFEKEDLLFAKKVNKNLVLKNRITHKITFDKSQNLLGENSSFESVTEVDFQTRVDYGISENLYFNIFRVSLPPYIKKFESSYTDLKKIYNIIHENEFYPIPEFSLESTDLYSFDDLSNYNIEFRNSILKNSDFKKQQTKEFIRTGQVERNIIIKLVNRYVKDFFYKKGVKYNKTYKRFYFSSRNYEEPIDTKLKENSKREVFRFGKSKSRTGRYDRRALVSKYTYYEKSSFFRHLAFQISYEWIDEELFLILDPKYFFTENGSNPLTDKARISRLTNRLKQSERNPQYLNHIYFIRNYLDISNVTLFFESDYVKLEIMSFVKERVNFGIREVKSNLKVKEIEDINQTSLF
ncbi:DUF4365 domain-containing protein [Polaribacter porphyrae]|uniref:DUF4365 domain-containing protein n=1 Tax=Polaribacter porphyrae TaxID=1137780 RepID=A0A2S7WJA2_9FLAO|nr:DUF4365 domain-containing protein [Polaribacter porphyrae]PQJ77685.1 hypothetical protein BTO18_00135 [Polaribacter porphyrae]